MMRMIWIALISLMMAPAVRAQPLTDHVPGDSMIYLGWRGLESLPAGFEGSHLQGLLDHSHLGLVFTDLIPKLVRRATVVNPKLGTSLDLALNIVSPMLRHPSAAFVERIEVGALTRWNQPGDSMPEISAGLVCQAGSDAPELEKRLALLKTNLGPSDWFSWKRDGDLIAIQLGTLSPSNTDVLSDSAELKAAEKQLAADSQFTLHLNIKRILSAVDAGIALIDQPELSNYWPKIRAALGIDGVQALTWGSHFQDKDWEDELFVSAPAPRHGLLTLKELSGTLPVDTLSVVPASANLVYATTLDLGKALSVIHDSAYAVDPQWGHLFDQGLGGLTLFIGRNFQHDVVEPFGPQWVLFTDPARNGYGIAGLTLANRPTDLHKADGALTSMAIAISNTTAGLMSQYGLSVPLERSKFGDVSVSYLGLPALTFAWTTSTDHLFIAGYPQVAVSAAKAAAAGKGSILEDATFKSAIARLKVEKPTMLGYYDLRIGAAESYQSLMVLSRLFAGAADAWGVKAPEPVLPSYEDLVAELSPASAAGWVDDAGFHFKSISPFPGSAFLSGGNSLALLDAAGLFSGSIGSSFNNQVHGLPIPASATPPAPLPENGPQMP